MTGTRTLTSQVQRHSTAWRAIALHTTCSILHARNCNAFGFALARAFTRLRYAASQPRPSRRRTYGIDRLYTMREAVPSTAAGDARLRLPRIGSGRTQPDVRCVMYAADHNAPECSLRSVVIFVASAPLRGLALLCVSISQASRALLATILRVRRPIPEPDSTRAPTTSSRVLWSDSFGVNRDKCDGDKQKPWVGER